MIGAIGHFLVALSPAVSEILSSRIPDWPFAHPRFQFHQRNIANGRYFVMDLKTFEVRLSWLGLDIRLNS